jgi:hypothetical protein
MAWNSDTLGWGEHRFDRDELSNVMPVSNEPINVPEFDLNIAGREHTCRKTNGTPTVVCNI